MSTQGVSKRLLLGTLLAEVVLTVALMLSVPFEVFADSTPRLTRTTTLEYYHPGIRGVAYDGTYYYIADCNDSQIDGRPDDYTGRIYVYDNEGNFVKRFPETPPVRWSFFAHGVAIDGTKLWTTGYFAGLIYEYEIASGNLLRTFNSPVAQPSRLDFDASKQTLWLTSAINPTVYQVDLQGRIVSSFVPNGYDPQRGDLALDGQGGLWVTNSLIDGGSSLLRRYTFRGQLVEEIAGFRTGWSSIATNIHDRTGGFIQDVMLNNQVTKIEHYAVEVTLVGLHATAVSPTAIRLSWEDNSTSERGFRIQSKKDNCSSRNPWVTRADVGANTAAFLDINLLPSTTYSYRISTYYGEDDFSAYSQCASATTGAAGTPYIPTNLKAFSISNTRVDLYWQDASGDETAFKIYRQAGAGSWTLLAMVAKGTQSYRDTTATGNDATTSYHYNVRACNTSGCSMPNTPPVVPFMPVSLAATAGSTVHLTWKDKSSNESGFQILRKNGGCGSGNPWVVVDTVAANTTAYNDSSAVPATEYSYRVRAYYTTGIVPQAFGYSRLTECVSAIAP